MIFAEVEVRAEDRPPNGIEGRLDQLAKEIGAVQTAVQGLAQKSRRSDPWWAGLLGTAIGGAIGLVGVLWAANAAKTSADNATKIQDARDRDTFIKDKRIGVYLKLFKEFEQYPKGEPKVAIDRTLVRGLVRALDTWYYSEGGGLVVSDNAQVTFQGIKWALNKIENLAPEVSDAGHLSATAGQEPWSPEWFYAVVHLFTSRLRTDLIRDIDGRRILGHEASPDDEGMSAFREWVTKARHDSWGPDKILRLEDLKLVSTDEMPPRPSPTGRPLPSAPP
jgi:hypothetical protein